MRKSLIVAASVAVVVAALAAGGYFWAHATYALPGASCGIVPRSRTALDFTPPEQCFVAAARRCAPAGLREHFQGVEHATDAVYVIRAGGAPGRCQVSVYSQELSLGVPAPVQVTECRESAVMRRAVTLACPGPPVPQVIGIPDPPKLAPLQAQLASAADCGGVHAATFGTGTQIWTDPGDDPRRDLAALRCFTTAARTCAHAKILLMFPGLQYGNTYDGNLFAIEKGDRPSACQVVRQNFRDPAPRDLSLCHELSVTNNGVLLTCSGQHILIPLTVARALH
jgi:hypothetical protein